MYNVKPISWWPVPQSIQRRTRVNWSAI